MTADEDGINGVLKR